MSILAMLIMGILAGWLAGQLLGGTGFGILGDLVVGLIGSFIGGLIFGSALAITSSSFVNVLITATLGAIIFLFIVSLFSRPYFRNRAA